MPKFVTNLGLSLSMARKSLQVIKEMILELSKLIDHEPPYWLRDGYDNLPTDIVTNFFEIKIKDNNSKI